MKNEKGMKMKDEGEKRGCEGTVKEVAGKRREGERLKKLIFLIKKDNETKKQKNVTTITV